MPFVNEFSEITEQTFSGDNVPRGPLQVSDFSRTLLPLLDADEWADAIGAGASANAVQYSSQSPTVAQAAQARANLSLIPTSGKVIHVSKADTATDTRTGLNVYDPAKPFATLGATLLAAASSGDTIVVHPGSYTTTISLAKTGVNWHFMVGSSVTRSDNSAEAIWDDGNTAMTFAVTGDGDFTRTTTGTEVHSYVVRERHASSNISIRCRDMTTNAANGSPVTLSVCVSHEGGTLHVDGRYGTSNNDGSYVAYWSGGEGFVRFVKMTGTQAVIVSRVNAGGALDWFVEAEEISGVIASDGSNGSAAMWLRCKIASPPSGAIAVASISGASKAYLTAQKFFGQIAYFDGTGPLYVRADKHSQVDDGDTVGPDYYNAGLLFVGDAGATGRVFYEVLDADPAGFGGVAFAVKSGIVDFIYCDYYAESDGLGMAITGGTTRFHNGRISTEANSSGNPITKDGGTLILNAGAVLLSNGARDSIEAVGAEAVTSYGFAANNAVDSNVTVTGPYTVGADVKQLGAATATSLVVTGTGSTFAGSAQATVPLTIETLTSAAQTGNLLNLWSSYHTGGALQLLASFDALANLTVPGVYSANGMSMTGYWTIGYAGAPHKLALLGYGADFVALHFGGNTSSYPSLTRVGATLAVRLADTDSVDASLSCAGLTLSGSLILPKTITAAGTTAPQTINKPSGSINFAAADASKLVTNSLVTTSSVIIATVATNDASMKSALAVAAAGSFTLFANVAPAAETRVNWIVIN